MKPEALRTFKMMKLPGIKSCGNCANNSLANNGSNQTCCALRAGLKCTVHWREGYRDKPEKLWEWNGT